MILGTTLASLRMVINGRRELFAVEKMKNPESMYNAALSMCINSTMPSKYQKLIDILPFPHAIILSHAILTHAHPYIVICQ